MKRSRALLRTVSFILSVGIISSTSFVSYADAELKQTVADYEFNSSSEGWIANKGCLSTPEIKDGILSAKIIDKTDPFLTGPVIKNADASKMNTILIKMKSAKTKSLGVYFTTESSPQQDQNKFKSFSVNANDEFVVYTLFMGDVATWTGNIQTLRFDFDESETGDVIYIDYIKLGTAGESQATEVSGGTTLSKVNISFDFTNGTEGFTANTSYLTKLSASNGILNTKITGKDDPYIQKLDVKNLNADVTKVAEVTIQTNTVKTLKMYFATEGTPGFSETMTKQMSIVPGSDMQTYIFDMSNVSTWKGSVWAIRFDFDDAQAGDEIKIDSIKFGIIDENIKEELNDSVAEQQIDLRLKQAIALKIGSPKAYVFNKALQIDAANATVTPIVSEGRTLLPVRFISESLNARVNWDGITETITVNYNDKEIVLQLGKKEMYINGQKNLLDVPAQTISGRTMIPLRGLVEALGKKVFWDKRGLIVISDSDTLFDASKEIDMIDSIVKMFD